MTGRDLADVSATALAEAVLALRAAGCVFAEEEAEVLGAAAADDVGLAALVSRRASGEPLEQVVGYADFGGVRVRLRPGVFVPRMRSELLVSVGRERVRTLVRDRGDREVVVVDLCCGSGALGLAVTAREPRKPEERREPRAILYAADVDPNAVACARDNLSAAEPGHGYRSDISQRDINQRDINQRGDVYQGDLFEALPDALAGTIDVLLANVPYVATRHIALLPAEARDHEPRTALDGGEDGLDVLRAVLAEAPRWLAADGIMVSEITEAQIDAATTAARAAGLAAEIAQDDELEATVVICRRR